MSKNTKIILRYLKYQNIIDQYLSLDEFEEKATETIRCKRVTVTALFFEHTNNFENDKKIINRNMLMHGMWINDITQIECMKLFLALFNVVVTIDMHF